MLTSVMTFDEPLAKHTTFGIGGPADCMVFPETREELSKLLKYAYQKKISAIFIGSGSNILVWDKGFDGIVISLKKSFKNRRREGDACRGSRRRALGALCKGVARPGSDFFPFDITVKFGNDSKHHGDHGSRLPHIPVSSTFEFSRGCHILVHRAAERLELRLNHFCGNDL